MRKVDDCPHVYKGTHFCLKKKGHSGPHLMKWKDVMYSRKRWFPIAELPRRDSRSVVGARISNGVVVELFDAPLGGRATHWMPLHFILWDV